jgi:hypothetical protein
MRQVPLRWHPSTWIFLWVAVVASFSLVLRYARYGWYCAISPRRMRPETLRGLRPLGPHYISNSGHIPICLQAANKTPTFFDDQPQSPRSLYLLPKIFHRVYQCGWRRLLFTREISTCSWASLQSTLPCFQPHHALVLLHQAVCYQVHDESMPSRLLPSRSAWSIGDWWDPGLLPCLMLCLYYSSP